MIECDIDRILMKRYEPDVILLLDSAFRIVETTVAQQHRGVTVTQRLQVRSLGGMNYYLLIFLFLRSGTKANATPRKIQRKV